MSGRVWAAFDFPEQPPARTRRLRGRFTHPPARVLQAAAPEDVPAVVAAAEAAARSGSWVLGGLSYSAAGAWDGAQPTMAATPAAHFEIYPSPPDPWPVGPARLPALDWRPDPCLAGGLSPEAAIEQVLHQIAAGDCYQVNLATRWRADARAVDLHQLFCGLAAAQPGGYAVYSALAGFASVSPELFFHHRPVTGEVITQPMKGTAAADSDPALLLGSAKEQAENLMIVDLLRNDLSRVAEPGTVTVEGLFELLRLPTVWQLTSTVTGRTRPGTSLAEVFAALFPCGSVTGAPKIAAMAVIADLEAASRGWYCGALGIIRPGGEATFNVPIRTVVAEADDLVCGVGSGIVADSDPRAEVAEWHSKARFLGGVELRGLESMLLSDGRIVRRPAHLARLVGSCAALDLPLDLAEVEEAMDGACGDHPSGRLRLRLLAGAGPPELTVHPAPQAEVPVIVRLAAEPLDTSGWLGPVIRHKTSHRAHYRRLQEPDVFDVICHFGGELTECTLGNLAVRLDGAWYTPPESAGLLPGTLRGELLANGTLNERRLLIADLERAEGLAFLNSLRGWCPARLAR